MITLRIAWLFARRSSAARATVLLPVTAFAVVTALLLLVAGGAHAFFGWRDESALLYQFLAVIALALLVVPLVALGGSAARLSARRRDDRLAGLRLLGATPALVARLTIIESAVLALLGALAGTLLYLLAAPLVGLIPFRGEPLGEAVLLEPVWIASTVLGVALLAALSAAVGLRAVVLTPLGVRTRQEAPRPHWIRVVVTIVVLLVVVEAMATLRALGDVALIIGILGAGFAAGVAVLNLLGPWVLRLVAAGQARRARTVRRLLAARAVLESPKAAWRQVGGVAMTSFMSVVAGVGVALLGAAASDGASRMLADDVRTGVIITLAASFLMVACSAGVNQAAAVLDRRDLYVGLDRIGMPLSEMDAARSRAVLSPLRITAVGSALVGALVVFPLAGLSLLIAPLTIATIAGCIAAGILLVWAALRATRPVLRRVLAEPSPDL